jgi:molybdenum cofactor sulfurtransferase
LNFRCFAQDTTDQAKCFMEADHFEDVERYRHEELPELALHGTTFLDYMGCGLAPRSMRGATELLGNPHSHHTLGQRAESLQDAARFRTLDFFGALRDYDLVFTSGCTAALSMVARLFPFGDRGSVFMHPFAHNSLIGIRESVSAERYHMVESAENLARLLGKECMADYHAMSLVCIPAECNFSGAQIDYKLFVEAAHAKEGVFVVLDGAAMAGKAPIILDHSGVDFFTFSFYKIFGWPTGLGGLMVRKGTPQGILMSHKTYFGGGTLASNLHDKVGGHTLRTSFVAAMEDGTPNVYAIASVPIGFDSLERLGGVHVIEQRLRCIRAYCIAQLQTLRHRNGNALVRVYHETTYPVCGWGCSVPFSVMERDGSFIGHSLVEKLLCGLKICIRGGCFCNPGACAHFVGLDHGLLEEATKFGHTCGGDMDLLDGRPLGCLRASFGAPSTQKDVDRLVCALAECFLRVVEAPAAISSHGPLRIRDIVLYPVKGMQGVSVPRWPLQSIGLAFDRLWVVLDASGAPVAPKRVVALSKFRTYLDWDENILRLQFDGVVPESICVAIDERRTSPARAFKTTNSLADNGRTVRIRSRSIEHLLMYERVVDDWMTKALGMPARLARNSPGAESTLANTAALLVVHEASHLDVLRHVSPADRKRISMASYRPNLVVSGTSRGVPRSTLFEEHAWRSLMLSGVRLISSGPCPRCQQVNVGGGELRHEPLASISAMCRTFGLKEVVFGQLFNVDAPSLSGLTRRSDDASDIKGQNWLRWMLQAGCVGLALATAVKPSPATVPAFLFASRICGYLDLMRHMHLAAPSVMLQVGMVVEAEV